MILFPLSLESQGEMDDCEWRDTVQLYKEEVSRNSVCLCVRACVCFLMKSPHCFAESAAALLPFRGNALRMAGQERSFLSRQVLERVVHGDALTLMALMSENLCAKRCREVARTH